MYRNSEQYYEMKYYKYKAKIEQLKKLKGGSMEEKEPNMDLINACKDQNIGEIRRLLDEGADVGFVFNGDTLLSLVLRVYFNMEIFTLLVQSSSPEILNRKYEYDNNNTLLHMVLEYHRGLQPHMEEILRLLLENDAIESFNEPNRNAETIFKLACDYNLLNVVRILLEYEPRYNDFLQHSSSGPIEPTNIVNTVYRGNTQLYIACRRGYIELVTELLQNGADVNIGNNDSHDLEVAVYDYYEIPLPLPRQQRQDVCILREPEPLRELNGHTPLFIAYIKNDRDLVELVLRYGANPIIPRLSNKDKYNKFRICRSLSEEEQIRIYGKTDVLLEIIMNSGEIDQIIMEHAEADLHKKGAKCK